MSIYLRARRSASARFDAVPSAQILTLCPAVSGEVVLVVGTDADVLAMTIDSLNELGYVTLAAQNADEALIRLRRPDRVDILFSDVVMPGGMNGAQLAVEARRLRPGLRVLLTSAYTASALSSELGVSSDLPSSSKPYRREDLPRCCASWPPRSADRGPYPSPVNPTDETPSRSDAAINPRPGRSGPRHQSDPPPLGSSSRGAPVSSRI